nr:MAG TPA: Methyltransferase domain family protein [Bacteriophage sp.]
MEVSSKAKAAIKKEFETWRALQYANKTREERKALDQFYTPPELTIKMIEKFENLEGKIIDPTCGCGGLLAGCILAGADPNKCYGIELDPQILKVCRERLSKLGVPKYNLHLGNALNPDCYDHFDEEYNYINDKVIIKGRQPFRFGGIKV